MNYFVAPYYPIDVKYYFNDANELIQYYWRDFYYGKEYYQHLRIYDMYSHQRVDNEFFYQIFRKNLDKRIKENIKKRLGNYVFRAGPVKGTGKRHKGAACKAANTIISQLKNNKFLRPKRKNKLVDWDEWYYRDSERNWKSQRKTQYKEK